MLTKPEGKQKHYQKYFRHLHAILNVKVKYILFQCSANRNFEHKKNKKTTLQCTIVRFLDLK